MHTLNCYMVTRDNRLFLVGGTPGGDFQPQGNVQVITDLLDFRLDVQQAVEAPRWHSIPGTDPVSLHESFQVQVEPHMPAETIRRLREMGHQVQIVESSGISAGVVQLISIDAATGVRSAMSDYRADGHAVAH